MEKLPLEEYKAVSVEFSEELYGAIDLDTCVKRRSSEGGTSPDSVIAQIKYVREKL